MTILNYLITATWQGKGDVAAAKAELLGLGKAGDQVDAGSKKVTSGLSGIKAAAAGLVAGGVLAAGTKLLIDFGKESIAAASDVEESWSKAGVVFGDSFGEVVGNLEDVATATNRSKYDLVDYAATIQDTLVPLGYAREAAAGLATEVTELAVDLGSFNNLDTATVIQDLQSALVGNTETLRKYGVVASQAAIEQEAINTGLWDGTGAIDAQTKAQAILQLTLKGTADAQGDAARTADSYANTARGLQSTFKDFKVLMGQELTPALAVGMSGLTDLIRHFVDVKTAAIDAREGVAGFIVKTEDLKNLQGYRDELGKVEKAIGAVGPRGRAWAPLATVDTRESLLLLLADFAALQDEGQDVTIAMREMGVEIESTGIRFKGMGISWVELNKAIAEARQRNDLAVITQQYADIDANLGNYIGRVPAVTEATQMQTEATKELAIVMGDAVQEADNFSSNSYLAEWIAGVQEKTAAAAQYQRDLNAAWLAAADPIQTILDLQQQVADSPWYDQEEAIGNLAQANEDLEESYRQMAFEAIYAGEGITSSTADLAIALGLITPEAADMRLEYAKTSIEMGKFAESSDFAALSVERQKKAIEGVISGLYDTAQAATAAQTAAEKRQGAYDDISAFFDRGGDAFTITPGINTGQVDSTLGNLTGELSDYASTEYKTTIDADIEPALQKAEDLDSYLDDVTRDREIRVTVVYSNGGSTSNEPPEFAAGGQFVVPQGFPNDSFPILVSSGERVTVETPAQILAGGAGGGGHTININTTVNGSIGVDDFGELQRANTLKALAEVGLV